MFFEEVQRILVGFVTLLHSEDFLVLVEVLLLVVERDVEVVVLVSQGVLHPLDGLKLLPLRLAVLAATGTTSATGAGLKRLVLKIRFENISIAIASKTVIAT